MATLVDSSVLVAAKNKNDTLHDRAVEALAKAELPLIVHEYVVLETATVLLNRASKDVAETFIQQVLKNASFSLLFSSQLSFLAAASSFIKSTSKLAFTDATLLALSDIHTVLTFDETLAKAIKKRAAR